MEEKVKESSLHEIWNADTAFLLGGVEFVIIAVSIYLTIYFA